jgi:hypothetical protein
MRNAEAMRGLPYATAGLPRRCTPRNDNAKTWGIPKHPAGLPRRGFAPPRNDKKGEYCSRGQGVWRKKPPGAPQEAIPGFGACLLLSGSEEFFVLCAEEGGVEGGVIASKGRLQGSVVLLGVEKAGGNFEVDELNVVLAYGGHPEESSSGEAL